MKKKFTLLKMMLLAVVMLVGSLGVFAQTHSLTITRSSFPSGTLAYGADDLWTATTTNGDVITGYFDLYSTATQTNMQTRTNTPIGSYPYNTVAIPGAITKITLTGAGTGTARSWEPYLSTAPLTKTNYSTVGTSQGAKTATSNSASTEWIIDPASSFNYFYLNMTGGAAYLNSIVIEYVVSSSPLISALPTTATFSAEIGDPAVTEDITVAGSNLTADINAVISGTDAEQFSVSSATLPQTGGTLTVTYTPSTAAATHTATLTLSSPGATDVVITLNGETTEPLILTGDGTEANPYTVADVKLLNNSISSTAWVKGYIVGTASSGDGTNLTNVTFTEPFSGTNIVLADVAGETDLTKMIGVQLPSGAVRTGLSLVDNPSLLGRGVKVFGTLAGYFSNTPGVTGTSAYILDPSTGLFSTKTDALAWTSHGKVMLQATAGETIEIFNVAGQKVISRIADDGLNTLDVPVKGVVIVKAGNRVSKVIL